MVEKRIAGLKGMGEREMLFNEAAGLFKGVPRKLPDGLDFDGLFVDAEYLAHHAHDLLRGRSTCWRTDSLSTPRQRQPVTSKVPGA